MYQSPLVARHLTPCCINSFHGWVDLNLTAVLPFIEVGDTSMFEPANVFVALIKHVTPCPRARNR